MRRVHLLPVALLIASGLAASACDPGNDAGATPPTPLSLPTPSGPDATAPPGTGGGLASKLDASATPAYLRQVAASTRLIASGRVKMVAAAVGGKGREGQTTELSVLEGQWDNPAGRSRLRLDPTGAIRNGDTGISALLGGPVDMIQIGETEYLRTSGDRGWTKIEGRTTSAVRPIFDLFRITDVSSFLSALACAAPVSDDGTETVDGVSTNHYVIEGESAKIKACIAKDAKAGGLLSNLGDSERARVDVWVDDAALVRRLVITSDEKAMGSVAPNFPGARSVLTMTLSGFDEPAAIEAPPAEEITDGSLFGGLLGGGDPDAGGLDLSELLSGLG